MKKEDYQKPTMKVVKLQHCGMLMTSKSNQAALNATYSEEDWVE